MEFFERLFSFLAFNLEDLPYVIITLVIAFSVHEFAHAYVAYKFGDPTAKNEGRLTLNPAVHLDPIGTLLLLIAGFGWARPVPVNRFRLTNPRLGGVLISLAGPVSNLLLALIGGAFQFFILSIGSDGMAMAMLYNFFYMFTFLNVVLFVFNLLPLPPLDGYRIIEDLVSNDVRAKMTQFEAYGTIIFLVLVLIDPLYEMTIGPILRNGIGFVFTNIQYFFASLFLG
ncbi:site-2 protease family protein [Fervidibacillus halotolerans]|uniref:Site-2 protease family protein n=1 Tax=Fervidibacillus halotolerans TaxID=2980027 RepID=A0A9E8S027_9BACI|nr:site-2 protease family protein [Fervidibacillus halotolerans]WAA12212.1 site-2 protease family protein [Fervidibacillus halotolerans]